MGSCPDTDIDPVSFHSQQSKGTEKWDNMSLKLERLTSFKIHEPKGK